MITEERVGSHQPPTPPKRRRIAAALGAAAVVIAAIAAVAILVGGDSKPVAAGDANPVVVFDGTSCSYEGPMLIEEGLVQFSLTSSADEGFSLSSFRMEEPALSQELAAGPVGADWALASDTPMPDGDFTFVGVPPGDSIVNGWLMKPGTYLLDCANGTREADHVWRVAQMEVVAP